MIENSKESSEGIDKIFAGLSGCIFITCFRVAIGECDPCLLFYLFSSAVRCDAMQRDAMRCGAMRCDAMI